MHCSKTFDTVSYWILLDKMSSPQLDDCVMGEELAQGPGTTGDSDWGDTRLESKVPEGVQLSGQSSRV